MLLLLLNQRGKRTRRKGRQEAETGRWGETSGQQGPLCDLRYIYEICATSASGNQGRLQSGWASLWVDMLRWPGGCRNIGVRYGHEPLDVTEVVGRAFSCHRLESWAKFNQCFKS